MRDKKKTAGLVGAGALAILMSTAAFAAPAPGGNDRAPSNHTQSNQTYQVNDRNGQYGRAQDNRGQDNAGQYNQSNRAQETGGQYNRGQYNRAQNVRVQDNSGQYNRGQYNPVLTVRIQDNGGQYNRGYGSRQQYVSGVVQRVDRRSGFLTLRDESSGRTIEINTSALRMGNLRRGDYITASGQWQRGNVFSAYSIVGGNGRGY
ncbi:MAG: OB-fold nucleic acid binding domain-containing protein [Thermoanaerobaculia bacterium]